jgi:uncharacterized membrane protein YgdD (TMEM256/DUF423 family)
MIYNKKIFYWGGLFVLFSIVIGAFAAHSLKSILLQEQLDAVQTGARYLMYGGISLLIFSLIEKNSVRRAGSFLIIGVCLFSGSIFLFTFLVHFHCSFPKALGLLTPLGGLCMMIAWIVLISNVMRSK